MKSIKILILLAILILAVYSLYSQKNDSIVLKINLLNDLNEDSELSPAIYNNDLIFASDKNSGGLLKPKDRTNEHGFYQLYTSSENQKTQKLLEKINSDYHQGQISSSEDGNTVFFTRSAYFNNKKRLSEDKTMQLQIFYIKYENNNWSEIQEFPYNSEDYSVAHPSFSVNDKYLYFASNMPGTIGGIDIFRVEILENGNFGKPENLGKKINTKYDEMFPFISKNNVLYFSSTDTIGYGGLDIWFFDLYNDDLFYEKQNLGADFNTEYDDFAFIKDSNRDSGYFVSNRNVQKLDKIYSWEKQIVKVVEEIEEEEIIALQEESEEKEIIAITPPKQEEIIPKLEEIETQEKIKPFIVYFEYAKFDITLEASVKIDELIKYLESNPETQLVISSHTDCRGTHFTNNKLSLNRVLSVEKYIQTNTQDQIKIEKKSFGKTRPLHKCPDCEQCSEQQHAGNRRVEILIK